GRGCRRRPVHRHHPGSGDAVHDRGRRGPHPTRCAGRVLDLSPRHLQGRIMTLPRLPSRLLALITVIAPMLALFVYAALRSGPLAPVAVTVATVESRAITPALSGIGTVQARYTYKIGPTHAGRLMTLDA